MNSEIKREVLVLLSRLLMKPDGAVIMQTENHKLGLGMAGVVTFGEAGKKTLKWDELSDGTIWEIYDFLMVSVKMKPETADSFVALGSAEDKAWYKEPIDVMDVEGKEVLGKVGVAVADDNGQLAVLFISPDGSWSTLTMYREDVDVDVDFAKSDLNDIGLALIRYAGKL